MNLAETRKALEHELRELEKHIRHLEIEAHAAQADARIRHTKVLIDLRTLRDMAREEARKADASKEAQGPAPAGIGRALAEVRRALKKEGPAT